MKKRQIWNLIFLAVFAATFVVQVFAMVAILRLDMLPGGLTALLIGAFVVYDGLMAYFMFLRGKKVPKNMIKRTIKRRRIISCVLAIVMICGCVVVTTVVNDVRKTFEAVQAVQPELEEEDPGITRTDRKSVV